MRNYMINGQAIYGDRLLSFFDEALRDQMFTRTRSTFALDVRTDENGYVVEVDLPGVSKEDVKIELLDDQMTISVDKNLENVEEKSGYVRRERREIASKRMIMLPDSDAEGIEAKLTDGVLTINVPKLKKEEQTRQIEIQ